MDLRIFNISLNNNKYTFILQLKNIYTIDFIEFSINRCDLLCEISVSLRNVCLIEAFLNLCYF